MAPIRAILFDADGVIQHSGRGDLAALLLRTRGFVPDGIDAFMREVFAAEPTDQLQKTSIRFDRAPPARSRLPQRLRLAPEEIVFIDDAEQNVLAARAAGLAAAQFIHSRETGAVAAMIATLEALEVEVREVG